MLRSLAKFFLRTLALISILLIVLWWRSYRHVDELRLGWNLVLPQHASLISHHGGLHLDYTTLRPLNTLRNATSWKWSLHHDEQLSPELRSSTQTAKFAALGDFQIRTPLQDLYEDAARTRPIYMTQTVPMKIISAPIWFALVIVALLPVASLLLRIRSRRREKVHSRSWLVTLIRRPALLAGIVTILLSLAWLRSGWRSDDLNITLSAERCALARLCDGQLHFGWSAPVYREDMRDPASRLASLSIETN